PSQQAPCLSKGGQRSLYLETCQAHHLLNGLSNDLANWENDSDAENTGCYFGGLPPRQDRRVGGCRKRARALIGTKWHRRHADVTCLSTSHGARASRA